MSVPEVDNPGIVVCLSTYGRRFCVAWCTLGGIGEDFIKRNFGCIISHTIYVTPQRYLGGLFDTVNPGLGRKVTETTKVASVKRTAPKN